MAAVSRALIAIIVAVAFIATAAEVIYATATVHTPPASTLPMPMPDRLSAEGIADWLTDQGAPCGSWDDLAALPGQIDRGHCTVLGHTTDVEIATYVGPAAALWQLPQGDGVVVVGAGWTLATGDRRYATEVLGLTDGVLRVA